MSRIRHICALIGVASMMVPLAACGSGTQSDQASADADPMGTITVWGWGEGMDDLVKGFEKAYPKITVKYSSTGTASDTSTALQNAISAGNGAPDVCMLQGTDVSQFAITEGIVDLSEYGADKLADDYSSGAYNKLLVDGKPFGLPIDSGPMVFFYNKAIFDKAGISEAPKTWDEYYEDAKKIHALGDDYYITNNSGNTDSYSEFNAALWQLGATPVSMDGTKLTIDFSTKNAAVKRYVEFQQKLIDEGLINTSIGNWSDDWNRSLNDGTTASLAIGAWMPINLENGAPNQKGNWRAAAMPQWSEGDSVSSEDGGSALTIPKQSKNKSAAWKFVEYETHGAGAQIMADTGTFPALKSILNSDDFLGKENEYFGGQKINEILSQAANMKSPDYQFLPYSAYAQSIYGDNISPAYQGKKTLEEALGDYQKALVKYGAQAGGYTVN